MAKKLMKLEPLADHGFPDDRVAIAWAAGLFEGEGCCTLGPRRDGTKQPGVELMTTDRDVALRFQAVVGCGSILVVPRYDGRKTRYQWSSRGKVGVIRTITFVLPYLGERRRARALEVLAVAEALRPMRERTHCRHGHAYTTENTYRHSGARHCRTCRAAAYKRFAEKETSWLRS